MKPEEEIVFNTLFDENSILGTINGEVMKIGTNLWATEKKQYGVYGTEFRYYGTIVFDKGCICLKIKNRFFYAPNQGIEVSDTYPLYKFKNVVIDKTNLTE